jgi:glycerol dehydrogenase
MIRALIAPRRYVQGAGALEEAGRLVAALGKRALVVAGPQVQRVVGPALGASLERAGVATRPFGFSGECTREEVRLGVEEARAAGATVVLGAGGGKCSDLSKAIAAGAGVPSAMLVTIASTDAPTSACSVYYTPQGALDGWDIWPANPDLVLVDTRLVAEAPERWLVSGMGDALSTWFEAEAAAKGCRTAFSGGVPTMTALALARLCYETLMEHGHAALADARRHVVTPALERVVEANVLLSGLGWESGGLATAHAVGNGLTLLPATHGRSHGEKVAYGLATQLHLDPDVTPVERDRVMDFMVGLGLPVTLEGVGLGAASPEEVRAFAESLAAPGQFTHNHPFPVTGYDVYAAMLAADADGRARQAA